MADPRISATELGEFRDLIKQLQRRLDELEKPTGTQLSRIVEEVRSLVADLDTRVQTYITLYSMTRAEIIGLTWLGIVPPGKGGTGTANAPNNTFTSGGPWNMIYGKTSSGELGHAPSNRRYKQDIHDAFTPESPLLGVAEPDPVGLLGFPVQAFRYIDDVSERGGEAIQQYGFIAEDLADAGFEPWLQYDHDDEVVGVAYDKLSLAHHEILRRIWAERYDHLWRISELEAQVVVQQTLINDFGQRLAALEGGHDGSV